MKKLKKKTNKLVDFIITAVLYTILGATSAIIGIVCKVFYKHYFG